MQKVILGGFIWILILSFCKSGNSSTDPDHPNIPVPPGFQLVWHDEFDLSVINQEKWNYDINAWGGGNNELQYYTDRFANAFIDKGFLVIRAKKEHYTGPEGTREYTSARLHTKNKGDWTYGRFEIRARLPFGQGIWPAVWLMPTDNKYGGWAASGEIDIMELLGQEPGKVYGTLHYGGEYPQNVHTGDDFFLPQGSFYENFHVFSLEWDTTAISWFVDDSLYQTQSQWYSENGEYPAPFDQQFHLIINVAVGGNWPGNPDETTPFPQDMVVDYVRIFQKKD
ncbi:glycoside hydrolase family 16 protein [bacterium]|nr:glycoside hydrolase family 16 protein [bacterium]